MAKFKGTEKSPGEDLSLGLTVLLIFTLLLLSLSNYQMIGGGCEGRLKVVWGVGRVGRGERNLNHPCIIKFTFHRRGFVFASSICLVGWSNKLPFVTCSMCFFPTQLPLPQYSQHLILKIKIISVGAKKIQFKFYERQGFKIKTNEVLVLSPQK